MNGIIGVDIGGTKIRAARIYDGSIADSESIAVKSNGTQEEVLEQLFHCIEAVLDQSIDNIGIGVPSIVDTHTGVVYDVQNIPSWKELQLKRTIEERFGITTHLNNDVNCAAVGEKYFGSAKNIDDFIMLNIGTGMAAGIFLNSLLVEGNNCGAGEFGMIKYLDHNYEYYCSGQFFMNEFNLSGNQVFDGAKLGESTMLEIFREYGCHLGNAICTMMYALDPGLIILCGSVSAGFPYFRKSLYDVLSTYAYPSAMDNLEIKVSDNVDIAVLGAASLHKLSQNRTQNMMI